MSSNRAPFLSTSALVAEFGRGLTAVALLSAVLLNAPARAQDDAQDATGVTPSAPPVPQEDPKDDDVPSPPTRINLSVTVPSGEVNEAQIQECVDEADAGQISGEIIVCRRIGRDGENALSSSREEAQKRYARETAFKDAPRTPNVSGLPDNGRGISVGKTPPPALIIDVEALPDAPAGSDADRIARGLPPLGQDENLTEEEIRKRREKLGLPPPAFEKKRN